MKIKSIIKYVIYAIILALFRYAERLLGIQGIAIAFFFALVFGKQNLIALCPIFIATSLILGITWQVAVYAAVPVAVALTIMAVHYKFKKAVKLTNVLAYAVVANVPTAVLCSGGLNAVLNVVISFVLAAGLTLAFAWVLRATISKGLRFRLSIEERISFCVAFAVFGAGFCAINIGWFSPFYIAIVSVLLLTYRFDGGVAPALAISFGLGAALFAGDTVAFSVCGLVAAVGALMRKEKVYLTAPVAIAVICIAKVLFERDDFVYFSIFPIIGVGLLEMGLLIKFGAGLAKFEVCFGSKKSERGVANRGRREVSARLNKLSEVFFEMGDMLTKEHKERSLAESVNEMTKGVHERCCADCINRKNCSETLGEGRADALIADLVAGAVDHGPATILDTPPYLNANCKRINRVISSANEVVALFAKRNAEDKIVQDEREIVGVQMKGVGRLLGDMSEELNMHLDFHKDKECEVVEELSLAGIGGSDVVVYSGTKGSEVSMLVKEKDLQDSKLIKAVCRAMGKQMEITEREAALGGTAAVTLAEAPLYTVMYGERYLSAGVGMVKDAPCGDRLTAARISGSRVMLVLSDGMGCGMPAADNSSTCVSLLENLYRAGFDMESVVNFVARLMSARMKDDFNALDIGVLDTQNGIADFIKLGGRESVVASETGTSVIKCGSMPLGAVEEPMPVVQRVELGSDTLIVMVSDGIIDVMGEEALSDIATENVGTNPDTVAELIMDNFLHIIGKKEHDDASVLVARVVKRHDYK